MDEDSVTTRTEQIIDEALSLPADLRLELLDKLLASLGRPADEEADRLWAEEAERRVCQEDVCARNRGKRG